MLGTSAAIRFGGNPHASRGGGHGPPADLRTLVAVLRWRAETTPHGPSFTFLEDGETAQATWSYGELDLRARTVAAGLQARGAEGERVLLLFDSGLDFLEALYGCMYAGAVPVPVNPPDLLRLSRTLPRLEAVVEDARARYILGAHNVVGAVSGPLCNISRMRMVALEEVCQANPVTWQPRGYDAARMAFLQYTSGSTGKPRGIVVSHGNLTASLAAMHREDIDEVVGVTWLPPYHDFGLIAGVLLPVYSGRRTVFMSPAAFVERPMRWLRAISDYRGTTSGGPNFAYDLCARKIRAAECEDLDLSCWKIAAVAAEPVRAETLDRFVETFGPYGFRRETFLPAYGLAEAVLNVSSRRWYEAPAVRTFDRRALEENRAERCPVDAPGARRLVGCGRAWSGHRVAIVDPTTRREAEPGQVGEIWVQSPNVAQGYWDRPEETQRVFAARLADADDEGVFLRTGDLGFMDQGELFVVGRLKELIIINGRNYHPHDVEAAVAPSHPALIAGRCVACSCDGEEREGLVIIHEVRGGRRHDYRQILESIRNAVIEEYLFPPSTIALVASGRLPRTSSGKPRRRLARDMLLDGRLEVLAQWRAEAPAAETTEYVAARTPLEEEIAAVWADVLGLERVGIHDNFFALGGNSLLASGLYVRLRDAVPVELDLAKLFERPTVAGLAELIATALAEQDAPERIDGLLDRLERMPEEEAERATIVDGPPGLPHRGL